MSTSPPEQEPPRRLLGGTERSWLLAVPGGTGVTVAALLLRSPPPLDALTQTLTSVVALHPILRAILNAPESEPPFFSFPASPSAVSISTGEGDRPVFSTLADVVEFEMNLNPWAGAGCPGEQSWPVLFASLHTLSEPEQRAVLCVKIHTAACDRAGAARLLKELMGAERGGMAGEEDAAAVSAGIEGMIAKKDSSKPFWARGMDLVGYSINGFRTATLGFAGAAQEESRILRFVLDSAETDKLLDACRERGVELCSAMAAAALLATRRSKQHQLEEGQKENYSVATLINSRKFLDPPLDEHNIGFFHSAVTNVHSVSGEEGLWELARRCHDSYSGAMANKKHLADIGDLNFLMCRAIENPQLTPSGSLRTAVVSVFEETVVYERPLPGGQESSCGLGVVEDCIACGSAHGIGPSIGVFDAIREGGELDCVWVYPSPLHSRAQMEAMMEQVKAMLLA